jgi:hypothetical protein
VTITTIGSSTSGISAGKNGLFSSLINLFSFSPLNKPRLKRQKSRKNRPKREANRNALGVYLDKARSTFYRFQSKSRRLRKQMIWYSGLKDNRNARGDYVEEEVRSKRKKRLPTNWFYHQIKAYLKRTRIRELNRSSQRRQGSSGEKLPDLFGGDGEELTDLFSGSGRPSFRQVLRDAIHQCFRIIINSDSKRNS